MSKYKALVIGGSAGSFPLVIQILASLPANFPMPIFLCLHRLKHIRSGYLEALSIKSKITIVEPQDKQTIKPGIAYLAPSNYHMLIELGNTISLSTDEMVKYSRPSIDLTFETAGYVYKDKMVGIMLSGANTDGAEGMRKSIERGAYAVAQNPEEATIRTMPDAAINAAKMDQILPIDAICKFINELAK